MCEEFFRTKEKYKKRHVWGWVDNRTLKTNHLIGLGKKEKGIKTLAVYLCEGPFIQKRKTDILRDVKIFCATSGTYIM